MAAQRYYVIGGEYADISFTVPAPGAQVETHGPFESERDAKVCWRDLTGKTVDNAMVRYFLKAADETVGKNYWVVGGEYADPGFTRLAKGKELEVYGPFERAEAMGFWRGMAAKSVDDALMRYDIRENYEAGDSGGKFRNTGRALEPVATKTVAIAAVPDKVLAVLMDGGSWPKWATYTAKSARAARRGAMGTWRPFKEPRASRSRATKPQAFSIICWRTAPAIRGRCLGRDRGRRRRASGGGDPDVHQTAGLQHLSVRGRHGAGG